MRRRFVTMAGALLAVAIAGGCSGSGGEGAAAARTTATTTTTSSPTPTGPTVQQVASAVARVRATLEKLRGDIKQTCDSRNEFTRSFGCFLALERVPLDGEDSTTSLERLGLVPSEVTALLGKTMQALQPLAGITDKHCTKNRETIGCDIEVANAQRLVDNALLQLAGWDPYL